MRSLRFDFVDIRIYTHYYTHVKHHSLPNTCPFLCFATPTLFLLVPFFFFFTNSVSSSSSSSSSSSFLLSLFLLLFLFFFSFSISYYYYRGRILTTTVVWFPIFIVLPFLNVLASECSSNSTSSTYVPFELPRSTMTH